MNHRTAKKLRDAGFPMDEMYEARKNCYYCGRKAFRYKTERPKGWFYYPTLEKLITACGKEGFVMWEYGGKFYAGKDRDSYKNEHCFDGYPFPEEGITPEEAVANLWLSLNNKK